MFLDNKYHTWYKNIINKAKLDNRKRNDGNYYERHHIIPASLSQELSKDSNNLVLLTGKEHFICHLLLCKFTSGVDKKKMQNAMIMMQYQNPTTRFERYTSKHFEMIRKIIAEKNSATFKGKKKSEEWKQKMQKIKTGRSMGEEFQKKRSELNKKMWADGVYDNRPKHQDETKQKIKIARSKQVITEEHRKNISAGLLGGKRSAKCKEKMRNFQKERNAIWIKDPSSKKCALCSREIADMYITVHGWIPGKYQKDAIYCKL